MSHGRGTGGEAQERTRSRSQMATAVAEKEEAAPSVFSFLEHHPTELEKAYNPKYDPAKHVELIEQPKGYPAKRSAEEEARYNAARFDPHRFQECRFSPQVGLVVFVKTCTMPFVITEKKNVKLEPGLKSRGDVQSVKQVKLKPLGAYALLGTHEDAVPREVEQGEWVMATNCAPLDLHFARYFASAQRDAQMRAVYMDALTRQKAFYPDVTLEQYYKSLCPSPGGPLASPQYIPPEITAAA